MIFFRNLSILGCLLLTAQNAVLAAPLPASSTSGQVSATSSIMVGVGKSDATGPIGEINMLGYADLSQSANGIHLRLKARAFVFANPENPANRVVYVSMETGFFSARTKQMVVDILQKELGSDGQFYKFENIMISATHTHSGPGGWSDDFLYQVTSLGVVPGERDAVARGIANAIKSAHFDLIQNGPSTSLAIGNGTLANASVNRSKPSYLNNPESERLQYDSDVDQGMTLLSVKDSVSGRLRGSVNWFAVHGVSMNNTNALVSGDNKGYAAYAWELDQAQKGNGGFVAAFGQTNAGDVTPNILGPHCTDTGAPCDGSKGCCGGDVTKCVAHGPGYDEGFSDFYTTKVIGQRQYLKAVEIANQTPNTSTTSGPIIYKHAWVDMTNIQVTLPDNTVGSTCLPSMGYSFSAGTTDGVALGISWQGDNTTSNPIINLVRNALATPSQELQDCQAPKQILLDTGDSTFPYLWQPHVLPVQLFVVGRKFVVIGQPSEITTMAGRRLRDSTLAQLISDNIVDSDAKIVIAGLSNTYSSYVTTREEYQVQRYEGGSTIFGPNTLLAYQKVYKNLAHSIVSPDSLPAGSPPANPKSEISLLPGVVLDTAGGKNFGDVLVQPVKSLSLKDPVTSEFSRTVSATFQCAHPRNGAGYVDPTTNTETFMSVEKYDTGSKKWVTFLTDAGWDTKFSWKRVGVSDSQCEVSWNVGETVDVGAGGTFRLKIFGVSRTLLWTKGYTGVSNSFDVVA
ncbi:hypothetical protein HDU76_012178 [Blyttiomyces sp. JEL0837]|nr:hypothetical protein HDU76_012178 [Blyttiomyces sp. JEL0837]